MGNTAVMALKCGPMSRPSPHPAAPPLCLRTGAATRSTVFGPAVLALAALLTACGSTPPAPQRPAERPAAAPAPRPAAPAPTLQNPAAPAESAAAAAPSGADGPPELPRDLLPALPRPELLNIPDPEPVVEPIRPKGPNKPYAIGGWTYVPETDDVEWKQTGLASWYGKKFHGRRTASGEVYNLWGMTAAHVTLPIPSYARVTNPKNGHSVIVRINDRGPFSRDRIIDLSWAAAAKLDLLRGVATVQIERITHEAIRSGEWKRNTSAAPGYDIGGERLGDSSATRLQPINTFGPRESRVLARQPDRRSRPRSDGPPAELAPVLDSSARQLALAELPATPAAATDLHEPPAVLHTLQQERAGTQAGRGWWLQLGSFSTQDHADGFYRRLGELLHGLDPLLTMFQESKQHKIQAGPFETREEAATFGQRLREKLKGLAPTLVERK